MSQVTSPVILDSTGQDIVTQLATISAALAAGNVVTGNTDTTLSGVLQGANGKVAVKPVDASPTADSTNLVSSGGTDKAIKGRVPVYGKGVNLFRNWFFGNPVNQRGITSREAAYGAQYFIDGWCTDRTSFSIVSGGIAFSTITAGFGFFQKISSNYLVVGKEYTVSLLSSGNLYSYTFTASTSQILHNLSDNHGVEIDYSNGLYDFWFVLRTANVSSTITAVALELGTEQTLCHNEGTAEAPVWVLNEIPDYDYELYRCMTSTAGSSDTYANKTLATGQEIAPIENGTTASKAYAAGEYFCWHGLLYRAKTAIGNGDTFTVNTNCEVVTGGGINDLFGKKATVLFGTTGASSETLAVSAGRFLIILATRGDTSVTFAVAYRYNNWKLEGTNTAGVTIDANTGQITLLNYTHYKIIY